MRWQSQERAIDEYVRKEEQEGTKNFYITPTQKLPKEMNNVWKKKKTIGTSISLSKAQKA